MSLCVTCAVNSCRSLTAYSRLLTLPPRTVNSLHSVCAVNSRPPLTVNLLLPQTSHCKQSAVWAVNSLTPRTVNISSSHARSSHIVFVLSAAHAFNASSSSLRSLPLSRSPTLSVALISYCCALAAVVHTLSLSLSLCSNCSVTAAAATACLIVVVVAVGAAGRLALPSSDTDTDIILAIALSLALVLLVSCVLFCSVSQCVPRTIVSVFLFFRYFILFLALFLYSS